MWKALILSEFAGPLIRHGIGILGGALAAQGIGSEAEVQGITGGLMAVTSIFLSKWEKDERKKSLVSQNGG